MLDWISVNRKQLQVLLRTFNNEQIETLIGAARAPSGNKVLRQRAGRRTRSSPKEMQALVSSVKSMLAKGLSRNEIANKVGYTPTALHSVIRRHIPENIEKRRKTVLGKKRAKKLNPKKITTSALPH